MALTTNDLTEALGISAEEATRVLPVAVALVEQYAPAAPTGVKDEGTIRVAGLARSATKSEHTERSGRAAVNQLRHGRKVSSEVERRDGLIDPLEKRRAGAVS